MKPEVEHMIGTLKTAMRLLGYNNRDIERKMGWSSSYLSRLFSGGMELRYEHIVDIGRAIGLETEEVLRLAYPTQKKPASESMQRIQGILGEMRPAPPPAGRRSSRHQQQPESRAERISQDEIEDLMEKTIRRLFGELAGKAVGERS